MKFTIRDENGCPLYVGTIPDEWVKPTSMFDVRLDQFACDPETYTPFYRFICEPDATEATEATETLHVSPEGTRLLEALIKADELTANAMEAAANVIRASIDNDDPDDLPEVETILRQQVTYLRESAARNREFTS